MSPIPQDSALFGSTIANDPESSKGPTIKLVLINTFVQWTHPRASGVIEVAARRSIQQIARFCQCFLCFR
jgi:hypothetical protein